MVTQLRYEALAVVTQVLCKLHLGGGAYRYSTDVAEIEAHPSDALNRRHALILQTVPVAHPLTGSTVQHQPDNAIPLSRGIETPGTLAPEAIGAGLEQIGRTLKLSSTRLRRAGLTPITVPDVGAGASGPGILDRRYLGKELGYGWLIDAGEDMHSVQQHTVTVGTATHTIDLSIGAGGMVSQWRTQDGALDQQHLNMGGGSAAAMGFSRGVQSGLRAVHSQVAEEFYTFNPKQGGDVWSPAMEGSAWHTPPPDAAHVLLSGGAPTLRARKVVAASGETTIDITTAPLDFDPDGRFWSHFLDLEEPGSMYAGGGYGKPAVTIGVLMHTRWTFCWTGSAHVHRCDVWYDLGAMLGHAEECEFAPSFTPAEMHLRAGNDVNQECYVYDAGRQVRTAVHSNGTLWPTAGNTKDLVLDAEGLAIRDPYEQVLAGVLGTGRGGIYFRSTDGSCIGQFALAPQFGRTGHPWGFFCRPWNNNAASPSRFVDPHHILGPVSGDHHPRLVTPAPQIPAGVLGPFTLFVLTGNQATVEANMRMLASYTEEALRPSAIDPFDPNQ